MTNINLLHTQSYLSFSLGYLLVITLVLWFLRRTGSATVKVPKSLLSNFAPNNQPLGGQKRGQGSTIDLAG